MSRLPTYWKSLSTAFASAEAFPQATLWYERIISAYSQPWRHYHTTTHLESLFRVILPFESLLSSKPEVYTAIFFHDVVYDPKSKTNEEDSASLFNSFAHEIGMNSRSPKSVERINQFILATKSHNMLGCENDRDLCFFLDADVSILGSSTNEYQEYAQNIRKEYIIYEDDAYRKGRLAVLHRFLESPLFRTPEFSQLYSKQAADNIHWEIQKLTQSI
eukprot:TRINITY_DN3255_c0_g1_i4.p1 TRINITY_DN3255_c0_g1~~TRINITY_DN3255_c0_g1_i4.p1  ORF type:complete len:218 (-),score=39.18 TRINITY_DN3255_c0_g1_i4:274-927(-)